MQLNRLVLFLALVATLGFNTACSQFANSTPTPQPVPVSLPTITPILIIMPSPTGAQIPTTTRIATLAPASRAPTNPAATPSASPVNRISFPAGGTTTSLAGTVAANGVDRYVLRVLAGQAMTVNFAPAAENVTIQISGADGNVLVSGGAKFTTGTFPLSVTQDYFITVISARTTPTNYTMQITIPPVSSTSVVPTSTPRRITFATGEMSSLVTGNTFTTGQDRFVIRALAGQTMWVNVIGTPPSPVIVVIYGADGDVLISDHAGASTWTGVLPLTQDYYIDTRSVGADVVPFSLRVTVFPLATPMGVPTPIAQRISFAPGATSATAQGTLPSLRATDRYVLRATAGQTMTVKATPWSGQVIVTIFGTDGTRLQLDIPGSAEFSQVLPSTQDWFIDVISVGNVAANYKLEVAIPPK